MVGRTLRTLTALVLILGLAVPAAAQQGPDRPLPERLESLRLAQPASADAATLDPALIGAQGEVAVSIVLDAAPVADVAAADGTPAQQRAQQERVAAQQDEFLGTVRSLDSGASTLATTQRALNAV
ncbi:MAG TPA: hypothetical protein VHM94_12210, partial [Acidimicrobiia bacterium]|nr:hypothetical protein [Acidimicrobiia bacterium]